MYEVIQNFEYLINLNLYLRTQFLPHRKHTVTAL